MTSPPRCPGVMAKWACILEVMARKPGNVNRFHDHESAHLMDFLRSAEAIEGPMNRARREGVGATVLEAVQATDLVAGTNTNLGMILLLAVLAARQESGRRGVRQVLEKLTPEDAKDVYKAIRLAKPGALGEVENEDVSEPPTVSLVEAMRLAENRDLVARQFANGFAEVFDPVLADLREATQEGRPLEVAIVSVHLRLMAREPDTLIARKRGWAVATESAARAREVLEAGWPDAEGSAERLEALDAWLRADGNGRNPGTTADLVCAGLFEGLT
ncbi:MAG TPA: triphosphoribosyl-dephospho-CoA synthase, partial [Isosphaeraceae bacterium]|nr:triphosphoribosyl-dephospho-CoA synthase [Isosphaeraceae bacterium]